MAKPITEVPVNTLENVTITMETYNYCEGSVSSFRREDRNLLFGN